MPTPLAPNTTAADAAGAFAILAIIADPEKFKKRLQELDAQARALDGIIENSKRMDAESKARLESATEAAAALTKRESAVAAREQSVEAAKARNQAFKSALDAKEAEFEAEVVQRHSAKASELARHQSELEELDRRLQDERREFEAARDKHNADVVTANHALDERESAVVRLEAQVKEGLAQLEAEQREHKAKVEKLKALKAAL